MPGQVQSLNDEQMTLLSSRFPDRLEPNFAWGNICSFYNALPALRAFYPCGAHKVTAQSLLITDIPDVYNLTTANIPVFGYEALIPYVNFNGNNQYAYYNDDPQFDILGSEAYISVPGLTLGCWVYPDRATGTTEYILAKWNQAAAANSSYRLYRTAAGQLEMTIYSGASFTRTSTSLMRQSVWQFCLGRSYQGNSIDVYLSTAIGTLEKTTNNVAVPAINNSALPFTMASDSQPANYFDGKISLAFVCASALSDTIINALYQLSRPLFGQ